MVWIDGLNKGKQAKYSELIFLNLPQFQVDILIVPKADAQLDAQGISEDVQHITGRVSSRRVFPDRSRALKHA